MTMFQFERYLFPHTRAHVKGPLPACHYLVTTSLSQSLGEPLKTLVQTVTSGGAGRLDILLRVLLA
jgi:hypothetical protein